MFTLIAHRGLSARAPENTFTAFDMAIEQGFDNFELDVQLTQDGVPVVFHDFSLERTTGFSANVNELKLEDIKKLVPAYHMEGEQKFGDVTVPTLAETLERYKGKAHIHLELKSREPELATLVKKELEVAGWVDCLDVSGYESPGLTITSFFPQQLRRSVKLLGERSHGWLLSEVDDAVIDIAQAIGCTGIYPNVDLVTPDQVDRAVENGFAVRGWGLGPKERFEALERIADSGATGTTVDWPDTAREHLSNRSR